MTISGSRIVNEQPELPTRVIDVGGPPGSREYARLIHSNGAKGNYVALSHCWGKHQPLVTTRNNLQNHLQALPWNDFPKTFQDAITITREIGLRYLWIDSICIIQQDEADWLHEAKRMCDVYERAYLVIAAADARDSRDGCFFRAAPVQSLVKIPLLDAAGTSKGSMYVGESEDISPSERPEMDGPLAKRAWITQEWLLARRIVFYTVAGIVWCCRSFRINPGQMPESPPDSNAFSWVDIIRMHKSRKLTVETDRLISLEGIGTAMGKRDEVRYSFGMMDNHLQSQLMWRLTGKRDDGNSALKVPSWSWSSTTGSIEFFLHNDGLAFGSNAPLEHSGDFHFSDDGHAIIVPKGEIKKLKRGRNEENGYDELVVEFDTMTVGYEQLICLLLVSRRIFLPNEEWWEEYFVILRPCKGENTYLRVGAGVACQDARRARRGSWFWGSETRSIAIV